MTEREPLAQQLLNKYSKTRKALARIPMIMSKLNGELVKLNVNDVNYPENALRIGRTKERLTKNALPTLKSRKRIYEDEISNGLPYLERTTVSEILGFVLGNDLPETVYENTLINLASRHVKDAWISNAESNEEREIYEKIAGFQKTTGQKEFSIGNVAKILGFKAYVYGNESVIPEAKLIRNTALKLGMAAANERKPLFSMEEVKRIAIEWARVKSLQKVPITVATESDKSAEDENNTVLFEGKKIVFSRFDSREIKILRALAEASEEKSTSIFLLAKILYGDKIPFRIARPRITVIFSILRKKLEKYNLVIARKNVEGDKRLKLYYLASKDNKADDLMKKPVTSPTDYSGIERKPEIKPVINKPLIVEKPIQAASLTPLADESQSTESEDGWNFPISSPQAINIFPNTESKLDPEFLLTEVEIYAIRGKLLTMETKNKELLMVSNVNTDFLNIEEIKRLRNRVMVSLDRRGENSPDFIEKNLLSACEKLKIFRSDPEKYLASCNGGGYEASRILLNYFDSIKEKDGFWEEFLSTKAKSVSETAAGTVV